MSAKKEPKHADKHVGLRVRARRMELGMSQEKLGDALELTFQQVQKYEKGANRIGSSRLLEISNILSVPVSYFFHGLEKHTGGVSKTSDVATAFFAKRNAMNLAIGFNRLNEKLQSNIVDLVEGLADAIADD